MITMALSVFGALLICVLLYAMLSARLLEFTQPMRAGAAERGGYLIGRGRLPASIEEGVRFVVAHLLDGRLAWALTLLFPITCVGLVFDRLRGRKPESPIADPRLTREVDEFFVRAIFGIVGQSPLVFLIFALELTLCGLLMGPTRMMIDRGLSILASLREKLPLVHAHQS